MLKSVVCMTHVQVYAPDYKYENIHFVLDFIAFTPILDALPYNKYEVLVGKMIIAILSLALL